MCDQRTRAGFSPIAIKPDEIGPDEVLMRNTQCSRQFSMHQPKRSVRQRCITGASGCKRKADIICTSARRPIRRIEITLGGAPPKCLLSDIKVDGQIASKTLRGAGEERHRKLINLILRERGQSLNEPPLKFHVHSPFRAPTSKKAAPFGSAPLNSRLWRSKLCICRRVPCLNRATRSSKIIRAAAIVSSRSSTGSSSGICRCDRSAAQRAISRSAWDDRDAICLVRQGGRPFGRPHIFRRMPPTRSIPRRGRSLVDQIGDLGRVRGQRGVA